jgi:hypothetical protein
VWWPLLRAIDPYNRNAAIASPNWQGEILVSNRGDIERLARCPSERGGWAPRSVLAHVKQKTDGAPKQIFNRLHPLGREAFRPWPVCM